jgi:hypothetical protein
MGLQHSYLVGRYMADLDANLGLAIQISKAPAWQALVEARSNGRTYISSLSLRDVPQSD